MHILAYSSILLSNNNLVARSFDSYSLTMQGTIFSSKSCSSNIALNYRINYTVEVNNQLYFLIKINFINGLRVLNIKCFVSI